MHSMWALPVIMPIVMIMVLLIFGRAGFRPPWLDGGHYCDEHPPAEQTLDILKKRYAKGELT